MENTKYLPFFPDKYFQEKKLLLTIEGKLRNEQNNFLIEIEMRN